MEKEIIDILLSYIGFALLIVTFSTYILGVWMKKVVKIPDWTIPLGTTAYAITMTTIVLMSANPPSYAITHGIVEGIVIAAICVYGNQLSKQIKEFRQRKHITGKKVRR